MQHEDETWFNEMVLKKAQKALKISRITGCYFGSLWTALIGEKTPTRVKEDEEERRRIDSFEWMQGRPINDKTIMINIPFDKKYDKIKSLWFQITPQAVRHCSKHSLRFHPIIWSRSINMTKILTTKCTRFSENKKLVVDEINSLLMLVHTSPAAVRAIVCSSPADTLTQ